MKTNNFSVKSLVVLVLAVAIAAALALVPVIPASAASTSSSLYRRAKATQEKLTNTAEYYGYTAEVSLKTNTTKKVSWVVEYTNSKNQYFRFTQVTTRKGSKIKTVYKKKNKDGKTESYTYAGVVESLKDFKTQDGEALLDKSAQLADDLVAEAEKYGWTCSDFDESATKSAGTTSFKVTNKSNQSYTVSVARVAVSDSKSVKTVYKLSGKESSKETIIASLKKYA